MPFFLSSVYNSTKMCIEGLSEKNNNIIKKNVVQNLLTFAYVLGY